MIKECKTCSKDCQERKDFAEKMKTDTGAVNVFMCGNWEPPSNKYSEAIKVLEGLKEANQMAAKSYSDKIVNDVQKALETAIEALKSADLTERINTDTLPAVRQISDFTELKERQKELYGRD